MTRPRALVHRGSVEASGLVIDVGVIGVAEARRRVLEAWSPGTRVFDAEGSLVVIFAAARRLRADDASGAPLVALGHHLSAVPTTPREIEAMSPPSNAIVSARGGELHARSLGQEIDVATWIDVGPSAHETATPLMEEATHVPREAPVASFERVESALRKEVGDPAARRDEVMRAIADARRGADGHGGGATPSAAVRAFANAVAALAALAAGFFGRGGAAGGRTQSTGLAVHPAAAPSALASLASRVARALRHFFAQAILRTRLARFLGRMQSEYLAKMLDLFDRDELDDALRHAIPLGGQGGGESTPALLPPKPRDKLALTATAATVTSTIGLVDDLYEELRRRYRAAFERLDRQGDVERAAFVLAELLRVDAEAVTYLEKHRRFALAAELAEARNLPSDYVVRLWFHAGERQRAIRLARKHGCFAIAVDRLERQDPEAAVALRLAWADACASAGDYVGAAEIARDIGDARPLVVEWLERALALGGTQAARACVERLVVEPASFPDARERMHAMFADPSPLAQPVRQAFLSALDKSNARGAAALARAAARYAIATSGVAPKLVEGLIQRAGDGALRIHATHPPTVERPTLPPVPPELVLRHVRTSSDGLASALRIHDAVLVARDRLLVALGELGVRLLALDGRTLARFDVPATALVVSNHGDRALAVSRRDGALEVARIDVTSRRVQRWGLVAGQAFARTFDGATWFVGNATDLLALDATADDFEAAWRTRVESGGPIAEIHAGGASVQAIADGAMASTVETFGFPGYRLAYRYGAQNRVGGRGVAVEGPKGITYRRLGSSSATGERLCSDDEVLADAYVDYTDVAWFVSGQRADGLTYVRSGTWSAGIAAETSQCVFDTTASVRIVGETVVAGDFRGRVLVVYAPTGALVGEVRVSS